MSWAEMRRYLPYSPAVVAAIFAIPAVGFTYLWDDYNFLTNAVFYQLHDWFPSHDDPFYRPISRGVYFSVLDLAGRGGAALGHVLNLCFLLAIVILLGSFVSRWKKSGNHGRADLRGTRRCSCLGRLDLPGSGSPGNPLFLGRPSSPPIAAERCGSCGGSRRAPLERDDPCCDSGPCPL